jgi:hypothetical protein
MQISTWILHMDTHSCKHMLAHTHTHTHAWTHSHTHTNHAPIDILTIVVLLSYSIYSIYQQYW